MKIPHKVRFLSGAVASILCLSSASESRANDWVNPGVGNWNDAANWTPAEVPNNSGGWAIGGVFNGGTAIVSNTVPAVSEAWAGNTGVAGTIIVTNGGTLPVDNWLVVGRTGPNGNTPLSTLIVSSGGVINKRGDGFIIGDGNLCFGQLSVIGDGRINVTGGWIGIGNGAGGEGWLTLQDNAVFSTTGQDFNVGDWGSGRGYCLIRDNATLNVTRFWVGKTDTSFGVLRQLGGSIVGGSGGNEWCIGGENNTSQGVYGFYELSNGSFSNPNNFQVGRYGMGLLYQSGGTISQDGWCAIGRYSSGQGILYITGGEFIHTGTGTSLIVAEAGSRGEMTIGGTGSVTTSRLFAIGNGGTGLVNLNSGGTLTVPRIERWSGSGYLNLNGGTLKARNDEPSFMQGLTEARVYSGGVVVDTAGYNIVVNQTLLGAYGSGVASIPLLDGGTGYVAPPIVQIQGDGFGAQGVAQVDPVTGQVTRIDITCPGYAYSTVFGVTLVGGGASVPAMAGTAVLTPVTSGGLVKNGAGILTLNGANEYAGATVVNAGGIVLGTGAMGGGPLSIADGTSFGVRVNSANGQAPLASLTLGTSAATTLNFDLGGFGNPIQPVVAMPGALAVNGTVTVNIADDYPQVGAIPLIQYGTRTGSGSFVLGSLPTGVTAQLATNSILNAIELVITAVAAPRWDGQVGGTWDIGQTLNWTELSTGAPTFYNDGLVALFDDAALGTTTVNLVTNVEPGSVLLNNTNLSYTIVGTGKIGGTGGLTKRAPGPLTLATVNDYTGPTLIAGGTVNVTNLANGGQPSAIGKSSAAPGNLVLSGGTLAYSGPAKAIDRGYSVEGAGTGIDAQSDLVLGGRVTATANTGFIKNGPAKLTYTGTGTNQLSGGAAPGYNIINGTVVFDGSAGTQVNNSKHDFYVGSTPDTGASLVLSNTSLNIEAWFATGRGNGSANNLSTVTLNNAAVRSGNFSMGWDNNLAGNLSQQLMVLNGTSTITNAGDVNMGESTGSTSTLLLNGTSKFFSDSRTHFGWHNNATGIVTIADSAAMFVDAWFSIGHEGGYGTFTVKNNGSLWVLWDLNVTDVDIGEGTFNLQDNGTATANNFFVGKGTNSTGVFNQTGGSAIGLPSGNEIHVGFNGAGTWNLSAGKIVAPNHWFIVGRWPNSLGTLNVTGGTIIHGTNDSGRLFRVGEDGPGVLNLSGTGVIETACNEVTIGWNTPGNGTVNLDGGVFQARRIIGGSGSSTFYFNGGVLRAGPNANPNFMTALTAVAVNGGGAIIDTAGNSVAVNQDILPGTGNGGLTKQGQGTLALNGNCAYTGATLVSAGALGGNGIITGPVTVQSAGTLSPGTSVGALTINNTLGLAGTTVMEIDATAGTNDQVLGVTTLTYGGTLVLTNIGGLPTVGTTYKLFTAGTYSGSFASIISGGVTYDTSRLAIDGTVKVLSTMSTTPVDIETSVSNGALTISWPPDHTGWILQSQTNSLSIGLSSNWVTVPGSSTVNQMTIPINPANGTVFFRLVLP